VEQNENGYNRRITKDPGSRLGQHGNVWRKSEILRPDKTPPDNQADHADQYARRKDIRDQIEGFPESSAGFECKVTFENIHQVHQKIKEKPVKNQCMKQRNYRPLLENRLLRQDNPDRTENPRAEILEPIVGPTAEDRFVNAIKTDASEIKRPDDEQNEQNFFQTCKHRGAVKVRESSG
jgi:hypothetical protein